MAYKKGQILKFGSKNAMEKELTKIRKTRRAYPGGKRGEWKIRVGQTKMTKATTHKTTKHKTHKTTKPKTRKTTKPKTRKTTKHKTRKTTKSKKGTTKKRRR